jgi:hypothetical protein
MDRRRYLEGRKEGWMDGRKEKRDTKEGRVPRKEGWLEGRKGGKRDTKEGRVPRKEERKRKETQKRKEGDGRKEGTYTLTRLMAHI